jgi:plasmid stabilization system protein ParE
VKGYDFRPEVEIDLADIWDCIAEDRKKAADRVSRHIETVIEALIRFAHQGHRRDDLTSRRLRFMNAGN